VSRAGAFRAGVRDSRALGLVAGLFGLLFGVAAVAAGLAPITAMALSAGVMAGSAQFAALALWQSPMPFGLLVLTTALVGARHVLMGIGLAPITRSLPRWQRWAGVALMTDFNWAITVTAPPERRRFAYFLGSGLWLYVLWNLGTVTGALVPDLLESEQRRAAAAAGTLFLTALVAALAVSAGRPSLLPVAAAAGAAWVTDAELGATAAPAAAIVAGAVVYVVRARLG